MKNNIASFMAGSIFTLGLIISQMINPNKVIGFLDLTNWDPTLAFVMASGVIANIIFIKLLKYKHIENKIIDRKLLLGSAFFGIGWGISGLCPAPALVNLVQLDIKIIIFFTILVMGLKIKIPRKNNR
ncbi:MAG: hypothetical protein N4A33_03945 [Bacteriovoracaceae bacterium]|jgi:uncharacterized membrane protein YedE/YeeE|nr:hypothetical protein [Bacteriovoracaceae bacterium]